MFNPELNNFLGELNKIKSFKDKVDFANKNLHRIGGGSGRIVYDFDDDKILKLAKNNKGIAQNEQECYIGNDFYYIQNIITKIFDCADDYSWIVAEKAKKVTDKRIRELTGLDTIYDLCWFVMYKLKNLDLKKIFSPEKIKFLEKNEFVNNVLDFVSTYTNTAKDLCRLNTYGEVIRDGKPTIVITDYGLSDEIYDTYYSPKKRSLYELYGFMDGNDDILSDIGGSDDIRRGFVAIMPLETDGDFVNEENVDYVLNNDHFDKNKRNIFELIDLFYDISNNIKVILNILKPPKNLTFYKNFLGLQDYLIKLGLLESKVFLSEDDESISVSQTNVPDVKEAKIIAEKVAKELNLPTPMFLKSGGNGHTFKCGEYILKLTVDWSEVDASLKILNSKRELKHLVNVFRVLKFIDTNKNNAIYVILREYIPDINLVENFKKYDEIVDLIKPNGLESFDLKMLMAKKKLYNVEKINDTLEKILTQNLPENVNVSEIDRKNAYEFYKNLFEIVQELNDLGIKSDDWTNYDNLGYKNNVLKFFDISGYSNVEPKVGSNNIIKSSDINESNDLNINIKEYINKVANILKDKLNLKKLDKFKTEGNFGVAYDIGDDKVFKITTDKTEANNNIKLLNKNPDYIAKPYNVYIIKNNKNKNYPPLYAIILEKLRTDENIEDKFKRMEFVFKVLYKKSFSDAVEHYLGDWYDENFDDGRLQKYFEKNNEDKEFFENIINIGKELRELGIDSYDFLKPENLGYKKNGVIGYFDVGYSINDDNLTGGCQEIEIDVDEDGSSKFSTKNSIGQDNFPPYNTNVTLPPNDNEVKSNLDVFGEDLEYNHVVGDAMEDMYELTEKKLSYMPNSKTVEIKKKCRLGGLGSTSAPCNQGDINNLILKPIDEEIDASEAYSDEGAIKAMLMNKKDVAVICDFIYKKYKHIIDNANFGAIKVVRNTPPLLYIIHRKTQKGFTNAKRLYDMMMLHGGYLSDQTPEEAYLFGKLLDYSDESIFKYIQKRYGKENLSNLKVSLEKNLIFENDELENVLNKTKKVGIIIIDEKNLKKIEKKKVKIIPLRLVGKNKLLSLIYLPENESEAIKEYQKFKRFYDKNEKDDLIISENIKKFEFNDKLIDILEKGVDKNNLIFIENFPLNKLVVSKRGIYGAMENIFQGHPSMTNEPILVFYNIKEKIFLVEDGYHRVADAILKKKTTVPVYIYSDVWSDYLSNISPEKRFDFMKENSNNNKNHKKDKKNDNFDLEINKRLIRTYDDVNIYVVNGDGIRDNGFVAFVDGGHYYVDKDDDEKQYSKFIPKNEIWIDDVFLTKPNDMEAIILHERIERYLMKYLKYSYGDAHDIANEVELLFRRKIKKGAGTWFAEKIYDSFVEKSKKKVNENYEGKGVVFYRATEKYLGDIVKFKPEGFYEAVDDEGNPVYKYGTFWVSDKPEVAASKTISGAVLGLFSMLKQYNKPRDVFYIYAIEEEPDVDISHWSIGDFSLIKEVRYRRPVIGKYVGKIKLSDEIKNNLNIYYETIETEDDDLDDDHKENIEIARNINCDDILKKIENLINENLSVTRTDIFKLKSELAEAAQKVYDDWEQNEEGYCDWLGYGGICQDIAEAMCDVLLEHGIESTTVSQEVGEQHVYVIAKLEDGVYEIDIPPYLYETGGGYCWKKIPDVRFDESDVIVSKISADPEEYERIAGINEAVNLNEMELLQLNNLPFKDEIYNLGGKIYSVGGAVRDEFLGKKSKDLDILVTGIPMNELEKILSKYGQVNAVGKSFGILKFKPKGASEDIDVAIPRTEKPTGTGGHKGFEITSDHTLPIEDDLRRRDFTINAIAKDAEGNIVDPFGGLKDLENKVIRVVNPQAFSDDPLRMLRAVQFASRFGFTIEPETLKMIQQNASRIKEISSERILTEFDKIVKKGDKLTAAILLSDTGLYENIFGRPANFGLTDTQKMFNDAKTMGEFIFLLTKDVIENPADFYKNKLRGDIDTYKEIKALSIAYENAEHVNVPMARAIASNMYQLHPQSLLSDILPPVIKKAANDLLSGKYPKNVNDMEIDGNDLINLGLKGAEIGKMLKKILLKIYSDKLVNNKNKIIIFAKNEIENEN